MNSSNKDKIQEDSHNSVTTAVNITTSKDTSVKSSLDFRSSILRRNNSLNPMKIDNSHLCINEESNSSAYLAESTADAHVPTLKSKEFFSVPTFTPKSKKKASPANTVSVVDDLWHIGY